MGNYVFELSDVSIANGSNTLQINNSDSVFGAIPGSYLFIDSYRPVIVQSVDNSARTVTLKNNWHGDAVVNEYATIAPVGSIDVMLQATTATQNVVTACDALLNRFSGLESEYQDYVDTHFDELKDAVAKPYSYSSYAALLAACENGDHEPGSVLSTTGFYVWQSGGRNDYNLLDAGSSAARPTEKIGYCAHIGSNGRYIQALKITNPNQCGAYGDGANDDWAAITLALSINPTLEFISPRYYVTQEIHAVDRMHIYSKVRSEIYTDVGAGTGFANSVIVGFEKSDIQIRGLKITGPGGGRSGNWEPQGSLDGAGSGILLAGCDGVYIHNCIIKKGGSHITGQGVGGVYLTSCTNSLVTHNQVSLCDNGIVTDQWYSKNAGKEHFAQRGTIITNNVIFDCLGRGVVVERVDIDFGGQDIVANNVIYNVVNAGVQFRRAYNLIVSNNVIHLANVDRTAEISDGRNGLMGIEGANSRFRISVANNIIINPRLIGMRLYNCTETFVHDNIMIYDDSIGTNNFEPNIGILLQNTDTNDIERCSVYRNYIRCGAEDAIRASKAEDWVGTSSIIEIKSNIINNRTLRGIYCDYPSGVVIEDNYIRPTQTYGGYQAILVNDSNSLLVQRNKIYQASIGLTIVRCNDPVLDNNIENCTVSIKLIDNSGGRIAGTIRGGQDAFDLDEYGSGSQIDATAVTIKNVNSIKNVATNVLRLRISGQAAPSTGNWGRGDVVENILPSANGAAFWMCVATGTPGQWQQSTLTPIAT